MRVGAVAGRLVHASSDERLKDLVMVDGSLESAEEIVEAKSSATFKFCLSVLSTGDFAFLAEVNAPAWLDEFEVVRAIILRGEI